MSNQPTNGPVAKTSSCERLALVPGQVHLWRIPLDADNEAIQTARCLLSADEIQRADRFCLERYKRRFTMARAALRGVLAQYAEIEPHRLVFDYGDRGKPELI